jgi:hypothetical protein
MSKLISILFLSVIFSFFALTIAQAGLLTPNKEATYNNNINTVSSSTYPAGVRDINNLAGTIVRIILSILGIIFITYMFMAGQNWMQANGDEDKVKKAKKTIQNLIIGLALVLTAFALSFGFGGLLAGKLLTK